MTIPASLTRDVGYLAGADGWNMLVDDLAEEVSALRWPSSVTTYEQMRRDPQITAVLSAIMLPIRRATWQVDPNGARPEVVMVVAEDLGLPIAGGADDPAPTRRRGVKWSKHLRLALLELVFGHSAFEQRYDIVGGQARLAALSERLPATISQIVVNANGSLREIEQFALTASKARPIPADRLVWYAHDLEGAHWQGRSLLRSAYAPWLYKREMLKVLATSSRRYGTGVPGVEAPAGATPGQVLEAQRLASAVRVGETAGVGLPPGFKYTLTGLSGSTPDTLGFIKYLDGQIAKAPLAQFLDLGSTETGSRALGSSFVDFFTLALQATADEIADTATDQIVLDLVDLNWGADEPAPRVVCADVGSIHAVTAEAISALMEAGALQADPELESYVRKEWKLPQRLTPAPVVGVPGPAPPVVAKVRAAAGGGLRRDPTLIEAAAKTDFGKVQAAWQSEVDRLIKAWAGVTESQRADLRAQIVAAVDAADLVGLGALTADHTAGADLLAAAMVGMAEQAAAQQASEAKAQGVTVTPAVPDQVKLAAYAAGVAAIMASGLANAAGRDALRRYVDGAGGVDVADAVDGYLAGLSDAFLSDNLGGALSAAQNQGRVDTVRGAEDGATFWGSEILDANVCGPCAANDGHRYASLAEAEAAYSGGGFQDCEGGLRCRGVIVTTWDASVAEAA